MFNQKLNTRSEEIEGILTKVPHWILRSGSGIILCLFILLFFLSWVIKYPDTITLESKITTKIPPQKGFSEIDGNIKYLFVNDESFVSTGDILIVLDNFAKHEDVLYLNQLLGTIDWKDETTLKFPIDSIPLLILGDIEKEYEIFKTNYSLLTLSKELLNKKKINISENFVDMKFFSIQKKLENLKKSNNIDITILENELKYKFDLSPEFKKQSLEYESKQIELNFAKKRDINLENSINTIQKYIDIYYNASLNYGFANKNLEKNSLENLFQSYKLLKKAIDDWKMNYLFVSNIDGKIIFAKKLSINQKIKKDELIFSIVSEKESEFVSILKAKEEHLNKIRIGQKVLINLKKFQEEEYGVLTGFIERISLFPDKNDFFLIEVKLPKKLITTYNKDISNNYELIGEARVIIEELTILDRFLYQFKYLFE